MRKVTYKLVDKYDRAKYIGTTNNPWRRNQEHSDSGKSYTKLVVTSGRLPKQEAERREARNIRSYKNATGRRPRYNQTSDGRFSY